MAGLFIVFEGGDGAGKTTQSARLVSWLRERGLDVVHTFEPGDTEVGQAVRGLVLHSRTDMAPRAEALLYAVDKAQHVAEVVRPALEAGKIVVCDRYVDSAIAYQGAGRALDIDEVTRLMWWAASDLRPDLTVLLDVRVDQGVEDVENPDRMESAGVEFHERVRAHFLALAAQDPGRYFIANGRDPKDEVTAQIRERVESLLGESQ
ncbi:MAG: dTMP kinase [Propionibacteriaceae bacterium]|jgi:dTMP kinase|nr:dTMP kinase [Propionibacteriaceae bacterium]